MAKERKENNFIEKREFDRNKWIYVPDYYTDYRYILGTKGEKPLVVIGINPSTAEPDNLDNTLKSVERISKSNGFDSFIMFNVYPQRATDPNHMHEDVDEKLHDENLASFEETLKNLGGGATIWGAWGNLVNKRTYLRKCLSDMIKIAQKYDGKWKSAGKVSKEGHPHHPLYLKKDSLLEDFDISFYVKSM